TMFFRSSRQIRSASSSFRSEPVAKSAVRAKFEFPQPRHLRITRIRILRLRLRRQRARQDHANQCAYRKFKKYPAGLKFHFFDRVPFCKSAKNSSHAHLVRVGAVIWRKLYHQEENKKE